MKTYDIPVKIVFEGTVKVKAESKTAARINVKEHFKIRSGTYSYPFHEDFVDYNIPIQNTDVITGHITVEK